MADKSRIEWTEATWNPVTGCTKVSPGCDHCYAETFAERWRGTPGHAYESGFDLTLRPERLDQPLRWRRPRLIFANSMSDLFHDDIPDDYIAQVWGVMLLAERHTFQILTKRHARMRSLLNRVDFYEMAAEAANEWTIRTGHEDFDAGYVINFGLADGINIPQPLVNAWLGVSVENQKWADIRLPALESTPAAVRWVSAEPLLGPVDLAGYLPRPADPAAGLGWVVVGGESGRDARPMHPQWVRDLRDQCTAAGVPFLFKQWGAWVPVDDSVPSGWGARRESDWLVRRDGHAWPLAQPHGAEDGTEVLVRRVGKKAAGRELDGRTWDQYPREDA